jgi:hypothetical protein
MRPLTATDLLAIWEWGQEKPPFQRALAILTAAYPDDSPQSLVELPIGLRDVRLLAVRQAAFGPILTSLAVCPKCGERLELSFGVEELTSRAAALTHPENSLVVESSGLRVFYRLPNSLDLQEIAALSDPAGARRLLLERCIQSVEPPLAASEESSAGITDQLPAEVISAILEGMTQADPQAEITLDLQCPACFHRWQPAFNILNYFWSEMSAWARRLLIDIHIIASRYHWSEADILGLSPARRQAYLDLIGG